jgi:hypothetical protein
VGRYAHITHNPKRLRKNWGGQGFSDSVPVEKKIKNALLITAKKAFIERLETS